MKRIKKIIEEHHHDEIHILVNHALHYAHGKTTYYWLFQICIGDEKNIKYEISRADMIKYMKTQHIMNEEFITLNTVIEDLRGLIATKYSDRRISVDYGSLATDRLEFEDGHYEITQRFKHPNIDEIHYTYLEKKELI